MLLLLWAQALMLLWAEQVPPRQVLLLAGAHAPAALGWRRLPPSPGPTPHYTPLPACSLHSACLPACLPAGLPACLAPHCLAEDCPHACQRQHCCCRLCVRLPAACPPCLGPSARPSLPANR